MEQDFYKSLCHAYPKFESFLNQSCICCFMLRNGLKLLQSVVCSVSKYRLTTLAALTIELECVKIDQFGTPSRGNRELRLWTVKVTYFFSLFLFNHCIGSAPANSEGSALSFAKEQSRECSLA